MALVASGEPADADALAAADVVLEVSHPALSPYLPEAHQAVLAAAIKARSPDVVLVENTTAGYDLGAAAAAAAGLPFVGYCVGLSLDGRRGASRSARSTAASCRPRCARRCRRCSRSTRWRCTTSRSASAGTERVQLAAAGRAGQPADDVHRSRVAPPDEGVDLTTADLIVCVGRGIGGAENIEIAEELASALGAELARVAARSSIRAGSPRRGRSGSPGATVRPKLYLGLGVSGAPEHVEGMQGAELIIAVNTDPGAAIFNVAHYGAVADLFDVVDELTTLLG